jgi:hypothetical protein
MHPATRREMPLAHAAPEAMLPLREGERSQRHASHDGGIAQRWVLIYAERRPQAQRPAAANAFPKLCRPAFACDADAQPALHACTHDWPATHLQEVTIRPASRYAKRGRPGTTRPPTPRVYPSDGAIPSSLGDSSRPGRAAASRHSRHQRSRQSHPVATGTPRRGQRAEVFRAGLPVFAGSSRSCVVALSQETTAAHGALAGHDGLRARLCGAGVPHPARPQGAVDHVSQTKGATGPQPYGLLGVPRLCQ